MIYKYQYEKDNERQELLNSNEDKFLIEEQNIMEGNFLIFSDTKPVSPPETIIILKSEYENLQQQLLQAQGEYK